MAGDMQEAQRRRIDCAMLESLATWFFMRANGYREAHSFNEHDVSEMLSRAAEIVRPGPLPLSKEEGK